MPGFKGFGDEAADALRRLFEAADEGVNIEDVLFPEDAPRSINDLLRLVGPSDLQDPSIPPVQRKAVQDARYAAAAEEEEIARLFKEAEVEERARREALMRRLNQDTFQAIRPAIQDDAANRAALGGAVNEALMRQAPDVIMPELRAEAENLLSRSKLMQRMRINDELSRLGRGIDQLDADELREIIRFLRQGQ